MMSSWGDVNWEGYNLQLTGLQVRSDREWEHGDQSGAHDDVVLHKCEWQGQTVDGVTRLIGIGTKHAYRMFSVAANSLPTVMATNPSIP
jgi:hypothetical protein